MKILVLLDDDRKEENQGLVDGTVELSGHPGNVEGRQFHVELGKKAPQ